MHFSEELYINKIVSKLKVWLLKSPNPELEQACKAAALEYINSRLRQKNRADDAISLNQTINANNAKDKFRDAIISGNWNVDGHAFRLFEFSIGYASLNTLLMYHAVRAYTESHHTHLLSAEKMDQKNNENKSIDSSDDWKLHEDTMALGSKLQSRCKNIYATLAKAFLLVDNTINQANPNNSPTQPEGKSNEHPSTPKDKPNDTSTAPEKKPEDSTPEDKPNDTSTAPEKKPEDSTPVPSLIAS